MIKTERSQLKNRAFGCMTDINYDSVNVRQKIKCSFLLRDKMQMSSYIKDLEKTVLINKQIIENLLERKVSEAVLSLNQENTRLNIQLQITTRERDSLQSQLLIAEQIVAELKGRESNYKELMQEKNKELLDQLNRKEYLLQDTQRK